MNNPLVSIACITYNHERYIRDALNGFLIQKTDFPFEIIIHDDASTDKTAEIIKEYAEKYPELIKPIFQKENQFSQGIREIFLNFVWPKCQGKYIATCEGDDYWTDHLKLQKQVAFLDSHPECSTCFHNVKMVFEEEDRSRLFHCKKIKPILTLKDLLGRNYIPTCSQLFRNNLAYKFLEPFRSYFFSDWPLHILQARHGDIGYIDEVMSVYRVHSKGVWQSGYSSLEGQVKLKEEEIKFYKTVNKLLDYKYNRLIKFNIFVCMLKKYKKRGQGILRFILGKDQAQQAKKTG